MHSSDIFNLSNQTDGNQIFSIGGSPSFRINRRVEPNSSVFPSGCMGNASDETIRKRQEERAKHLPHQIPAINYNLHEDEVDGVVEEDDDEEIKEVLETKSDDVIPIKPCESSSSIARNPLTGDGICDPEKKIGRRGGMRNKNAKWVW